MKIHEYQAKAILAKYGVPVPRGEVAFTVDEAEAAAKKIGGSVVVKAQVPFSEMLSYANELISMTQGRGSYSMEFSHYDFVPTEIAEKVIAAHKPHHAGEEEGEAASA